MKAKDDPTIQRIREVRHKISAQFDHDPKKLVEHYMEYQKQFEDRFEKPAKKEIEPAEVAK